LQKLQSQEDINHAEEDEFIEASSLKYGDGNEGGGGSEAEKLSNLFRNREWRWALTVGVGL
jgi:hypothetical protein